MIFLFRGNSKIPELIYLHRYDISGFVRIENPYAVYIGSTNMKPDDKSEADRLIQPY